MPLWVCGCEWFVMVAYNELSVPLRKGKSKSFFFLVCQETFFGHGH